MTDLALSGSLKPSRSSISVSYTHLDVYKRQMRVSPANCPALVRFVAEISTCLLYTSSYGGSSGVSIYAMLGLVSGAHARPQSLSHERYVQPYR